jgi:nucleotide-binding universal stress UspA family protein
MGTAIFLALSFTMGRRLVSFLIRWTNDNFESNFPVITTILVVMIAMALTMHFIGVHTVLGAFVAGVLIGESPTQGDMVAENTVIEDTIKRAAESSMAKSKAEARMPVEVILRKTPASASEEAITAEAKKGYDVLFIGKDKMQTTGAFSSEIDSIASAFEGPLALVIAQGERVDERAAKPLNILVPITGTDVSRRAAELAFSLSKRGNVMALYVGQARHGKAASRRGERRQAHEILRDIVELASRYGLKIETRIVSGATPANAILAEVKRGGYDLIVMGVAAGQVRNCFSAIPPLPFSRSRPRQFCSYRLRS